MTYFEFVEAQCANTDGPAADSTKTLMFRSCRDLAGRGVVTQAVEVQRRPAGWTDLQGERHDGGEAGFPDRPPDLGTAGTGPVELVDGGGTVARFVLQELPQDALGAG